MKKIAIYIISALMLTGCSTYSRYHRAEIPTENLYRTLPAGIDTVTIASMSWREMFTDRKLQSLIETGIKQNTDLNVARLRVEAAEAALITAKLSYLPSLGINAEGGSSQYDGTTAKTYNVGASASWELDIFGRLTAAKRGAVAALQGSRDYQQAVQTQLVATIADSYYTLSMLDTQMAINNRTLENWRATVRTLEALKKVGKANEAGVLQAKANVMQLESSQLAIRKSISETENALSAILAMPSHSIERNNLTEASFPDTISIGVPLQLLSNRPDVRQAEMELAQAFYATNVARAAFYPNITLSGTLGWTNNGGGVITNPGQWLLNVIGSLTQPLFNRGVNIANLNIAKSRQEEAKLLFRQALLNAGKEVNDALTVWQTAKSQIEIGERRVSVLNDAVQKTELLMCHSGATYLEVLTAQQSLLEAETLQSQAYFERIQSIIKLYHALGGGA
ncbi:efflux transporter outer membrane subunit [Bacteroides ovatus]|mgnify:FL=1|jgi:multidrug efflux system outer membrane protein|uniref:Efflux transporter outer membrane subunit n=2 Tax=Bacteroides TaxID=816 RepID=A0A5N4EZI4_BACOV|nr:MULTISPECIES: efflux transporter outer membrane subunit [Bacteroidales]KAA4568964.1 efflux transporter outer membrane subunit [Bacteroides ovatus]KAA4570894.1 efflux transporter outer membrane subunit [Bacteroides ovatus]KAA4573683.1 efflux transporter outer membrane subunit [Bacteroides ovatus]KAA4583360.1 efflux transporter outer membrane subunit [Bacteroides ovatus]KAA4585238.1 efflux transporter outer membrane subunit [Bacteroides ovatus]